MISHVFAEGFKTTDLLTFDLCRNLGSSYA